MQCFSNFQMSCITTYSFENQSCQVQLITLKATYLPNILQMRVNLLLTQNDIQFKILPHLHMSQLTKFQNGLKCKTTRIHNFLNCDIFLFPLIVLLLLIITPKFFAILLSQFKLLFQPFQARQNSAIQNDVHHNNDDSGTGQEWLIRSHLSARSCFELSRNLN